MQTARIIASTLDMPIIASELLREAAFGVVQGLTREEIEERFPADLHEWRRNPRAMRPPGAETHEQIIERCGKFLAELAKSHSDNEPVLVVGHGGSLRGIIVAATGMPAAFFRMLHFSNAGLTIITTGDSPSIRHLNDVCHLASVEVTDVDADNAAP
jgi:broad specificity phosphatase PhoE